MNSTNDWLLKIQKDEVTDAREQGRLEGLQIASHQSAPYFPYNRQTHGDGYRKPGEGQERKYDMEKDGQFKLPIELTHDAPGQNLAEQWGASVLPDGKTWMMPTKEGTLRYATPEESQLLDENRKMRDSATGPWWSDHTHDDVSMYNPNDPKQKMLKVNEKDRQLNNEAWKQFIQGNPNYMFVPIERADAQGLTNVLSPHQNPRSGSLKGSGLSEDEKIELLRLGVKAHQA